MSGIPEEDQGVWGFHSCAFVLPQFFYNDLLTLSQHSHLFSASVHH